MSTVTVSGTLILNGNLTCDGDVTVTSTGVVIPIPDPDTKKSFYSPRTNSYTTANGQGRTITSTTGDIIIDVGGIINGLGQGFESDRGPGNNSTLLNALEDTIPGYGATHAGLGYVRIESNSMFITEYYTIGSVELMNAGLKLDAVPVDPSQIAVSIVSGGPQVYGVDYTVTGIHLNWLGTPLQAILTAGDILRVTYLGDLTPYAPPPRPPYGHWETPVSLGSGGGYHHDPAWYLGSGAPGGGAIKLEALSGTAQINGSINMNGWEGDKVGGGAGGSVWIVAWNLAGNGSITSQGGYSRLISNPLSSRYEEGGGGGGGYISLWYRHANIFSGILSVAGGINRVTGRTGAGDGKIFVKAIEPLLLEKFTGDILNTKWWDTTNMVIVDNELTLTSPQNDLALPAAISDFIISGKNITVSTDYLPEGNLNQGLHADFLLYADEDHWVGMSRRYSGLFGVSKVDDIISASGIPYDYSNVSLQIIKRDSTFSFQYYDATSISPVTLYSDVRPELADKSFHIQFSLKKPAGRERVTTENLDLTDLDISKEYVELNGFPDSSVAMNVVGGTAQYDGTDFYVVNDQIKWDGKTLSGLLAEEDVLRVMYEASLPLNNDSTASFDNVAIYEGVIDGAETREPVIYVDSDFGSDSSDGRQLNPLQNLFVATAWAKRGGTVVLYDGTYNPTEVLRKDLTIRGAEGSKPLITSANVQDSTGSSWENTAVSFFGCQGIVDNVTISGTGTGIKVEDGNFDIGRTIIFDASTGIRFIKCDPIISRNEISVAGTALDFTSCLNPSVYSNVVYNSALAVHVVDSKLVTISSNTFDTNNTHVIFDLKSVGIVASNNLTWGSIGLQASTDSSVVSYNNNYHNTSTFYSRAPDVSANDRSDNPLYAHRLGQDYHLEAGSPDIGNGLLAYDTYLIDFDGASRIDGTVAHPDIGAYEFRDNTSHISGDYYAASAGNDFWNPGTIGQPYHTIDKALLIADATMHIDAGHYDTYYLSLSRFFDSSNSVNFYIYTAGLRHFVTYHTITPGDLAMGYFGLDGFPVTDEDQHNIAVNVVGGPVQILGTGDSTAGDYSIQYGNIFWKGYGLEQFLAVGDVLRIVFDGYLQQRALDTLIMHNRYSNYEPERAIFVSPSGSDSTILGGDGTNTGGNGSFALPWRTATMALANSTDGDNIVMIAGEYPLFQGVDNRILVPAIDRTAVPIDGQRCIMDLFDPKDFRAFGTTEHDFIPWNFTYAGNSYVASGGGFLSLTFDGTNAARTDSIFKVMNDFEVQAELRSAIDPLKFMVTSADNTVMFSYTDTTYVASIITGGKSYNCTGVIDGVYEPRMVTEYITVTANDLRNQYIPLSHIPEPSETYQGPITPGYGNGPYGSDGYKGPDPVIGQKTGFALNIVGGTAQEYGEDFYIEDSKIKWNGMNPDNLPDMDPGEVLRVIYMDRDLVPIKVYMSLIGNRFTIKAYTNKKWYCLNKRDMVGTYSGPWTVSFVMDQSTNVNHETIYGKGYASQFLAIGSVFTNTSIDKPLTMNTERKNVVLYKDRF